MTNPTIAFGDKVRVRTTPHTEGLGVAGQTGIVYGVTKPSVTGVNVVGDSHDDEAICVRIESRNQEFWFAPALLEFVDHQAGTTMGIGNRRFIRAEDGEWREVRPN